MLAGRFTSVNTIHSFSTRQNAATCSRSTIIAHPAVGKIYSDLCCMFNVCTHFMYIYRYLSTRSTTITNTSININL